LHVRTVIFDETRSKIPVVLSVIIVNYNSKLLIENCLLSVQKAIEKIDSEIIVIDNNSTDGSKDYLPAKFPGIRYVFNSDNIGFGKACNQGYKLSSGNYILFLNPDTIVSENSLQNCISFLGSHSGAGAAGVRMIDGKGKFLKESKRGLPSPATSFFKLFGLIAIFPGSKTFAKYYMGHLPEKENNPVDVLSGAFMMIKREAFEKVKGFDEEFFMYGEDIDLSVRLAQAGYKNYYLGSVSITHVKGGSTTYDQKYVQDFYGAMKLFVKKHYSKKPTWYIFVLNAGIEFRKLLSMAKLISR
jgi:GT2 family glycosyltransferase